MKELIFATNNAGKLAEIQAAIGNQIRVISLKDAGIAQDIPEPFDSLRENAGEKARCIYELTGKNCFGEDTGLEVAALNGEPGVRSARYAGDHGNSEANIKKLLENLQGNRNRTAQFRTVIALIWEKEMYFFEGICAGKIDENPLGSKGFGYDPVFIPDGAEKSFAMMSMEEKNRYSHRRKAADALVLFLQQRNP